MKKYTRSLLIIPAFLAFCLITFESNAQGTKSIDSVRSFVSPDIKIERFYSKKDLEKMAKLDLISIYKSRLEYLIEVLPFLSLHPKPGSTFHDMAIPETEDNMQHLDKETENKKVFIASLFETLDDVVPYSEKDHIIWCILFFDEMIKESNYIK